MTGGRSSHGEATRQRLILWGGKGQAASERLAAQILWLEGYKSLDPIHPLGGPDGGKDIVASRDGRRWIAGVYFPDGRQSFSKIQTKFSADYEGAVANDAEAFAFVTNQKVSDKERKKLSETVDSDQVEIYHLERIVGILNHPSAYGVRLEFLEIEMTKEEQVAFFKDLDNRSARRMQEALEVERKLIAEEHLRRSQVQLHNHAITLRPAIADYLEIAKRAITPLGQGSGDSPPYNPNFKLSDLRDIYEPGLMDKYPPFEPTIERYRILLRELVAELKDLIRATDHTHWPELPHLCRKAILVARETDRLDELIANAQLKVGETTQARILSEDLLTLETADHVASNVFGTDPFDAYRHLGNQIKMLVPILLHVEGLLIHHVGGSSSAT